MYVGICLVKCNGAHIINIFKTIYVINNPQTITVEDKLYHLQLRLLDYLIRKFTSRFFSSKMSTKLPTVYSLHETNETKLYSK